MPVANFIHSLGSVGLFPSRAFLPAFVTALLLRYGHSIPIVEGSGLPPAADAPSWFTNGATILVLAILSILEIVATKDADIRQLLDQFDGYVKSGMAFLTAQGVASVDDSVLLDAIQRAGVSDGAFGLAAAGGVYFLNLARRSLYDLLVDMDADDSLGLRKLFSWAEDAWVLLGAVLLIAFPIFMILLTAAVFAVLYGLRRIAQQREEGRRIPCASCGNAIYACATHCPACKSPNKKACSLDWLGQSKLDRPADGERHAMRLIEARRCSYCATRLKKRTPHQICDVCGRKAFSDEAAHLAYLREVDGRIVRALLVCLALGIVPVIGVVPAIVFYRLQLVSPLRRYVPAGASLVARWLGRVGCFALLSVQWVPILGIMSLPIMASINYALYRRAFRLAWREKASGPRGLKHFQMPALDVAPQPSPPTPEPPRRQRLSAATSSSRGVEEEQAMIEVVCPACKREMHASAEHIGKRAKCKCGHVFVIESQVLQAEVVEGPIVAVEVAALPPILVETEHTPAEKKGFWATVKRAADAAAE